MPTLYLSSWHPSPPLGFSSPSTTHRNQAILIASVPSMQVPGGHLRVAAAAAANLQQQQPPLRCPRCESTNTKFCYYNNYSLSQPRHFCKACKRYWTRGGTLRNVPVGGGCRKNKRAKKPSPSPRISNPAPHAPPSAVNPFLYNLAGAATGGLQIAAQMDGVGGGVGDTRDRPVRSDIIGGYRSADLLLDSFADFQQQQQEYCTLLQDYSLAPAKMGVASSSSSSSSWLPLYQSLHGGTYAGAGGLFRPEAKDEGRFDAQNPPGSATVDGNPFWSSALSTVWSAEPASFFGSSSTTPLL